MITKTEKILALSVLVLMGISTAGTTSIFLFTKDPVQIVKFGMMSIMSFMAFNYQSNKIDTMTQNR